MSKQDSALLVRHLGYRFNEPALLRQALTHRSAGIPHNERLEFLGDSVLNCSIAKALFDQFPELPEGTLSRLRANLVRQESLADIALDLKLGEHLLMGEGELKSGGFRRPSILADALESIFGAIFLDGGFEAVRGVVLRLFNFKLGEIDPKVSGKDAKTQLQEWLQGHRYPLPDYQLAGTEGEAHDQEFIVTCAIPSLKLSTEGRGRSRRAAEQEAARLALDQVERT
ncbi:MAG TPA: ribonuclease III [Thiobacillaceae bacterium]|nr:ribonuclease III [Thiobacillaceae bacterium]